MTARLQEELQEGTVHSFLLGCDNSTHIATHWGFPDPSRVEGGDAEKRAAFDRVFLAIRRRVELLVNLPLEKLEHLALKDELKRIAGATAP